MATATLSRGATSVTINIWEESGNLLISRDVGKPNLRYHEVAREDPRTADHRSAIDQITLVGVFTGANAYSEAQTLIEDLVKSHSDGTALQLDLTSVPGFDTVLDVGVPDARTAEVDYRPGIKDRVDLQLSLPLVDTTIG